MSVAEPISTVRLCPLPGASIGLSPTSSTSCDPIACLALKRGEGPVGVGLERFDFLAAGLRAVSAVLPSSLAGTPRGLRFSFASGCTRAAAWSCCVGLAALSSSKGLLLADEFGLVRGAVMASASSTASSEGNSGPNERSWT